MQALNDVVIGKSRYHVSERLFASAQEVMPGGVNSPVRAFGGVGGTPVFMAGAEGAVLQDMDGNQYVDYVGSWGPMILGHANPKVLEAISTVMQVGTSFGAPTDRETCLADYLIERHESVEQVRLVNSGTEATMSALRLARGYTGRDKIIKCEGCYHGHGDSLLVAAGSGLATHGTPSSAGVPAALAALTVVVPYNDLDAMKKAFEEDGENIACVIIEPVAGNMGCVAPDEGYLKGLRTLCDTYGALLIFDEVMTGLRVGYASAQGRFGVLPDLSCFGKVIGGGLPLAAYGGRKKIMQRLSPVGDVYQAGTLSGNPLAVAAGMAMVEQLNEGVYSHLETIGAQLEAGVKEIFKKHDIALSTQRVGGMFGIFFSAEAPRNFKEVQASDVAMFNRFFHLMLDEGVYLPPSAYESWFLSTAHTQETIQFTLDAIAKVAPKLKEAM